MRSLKSWFRTAIPLSLLLVIACVVVPTASASTTVKVMTYNVDEGTDFEAIVALLSNPNATATDFANAVAKTLADVQGTAPKTRALLIANAIAAAQPDLVGLQEAAVWESPALISADFPDGRIDFVQMILDNLAGQYTAVVIVPEFQISIPLLLGGVSFTDRDVILARTDELTNQELEITATQQGQFRVLFPLPASPYLSATAIKRGWGFVDARLHGTEFRFITTHLEDGTNPIPGFALVQGAQVVELVYGPARTALPTIIAGDFNIAANDPTSPTFLAYRFIVANGFTDAWKRAHPNLAGLTCCQENLQSSDSELTQRVDLVFLRNHVRVVDAQLVGDQIDETYSLWPSDHAAVYVAGKVH